MSIVKRVFRAIERSSVNVGRTHVRQYLLARDDRFLADNGFSRELLERGNRAWPWHEEAPAAAALPRRALSAEGFRALAPALVPEHAPAAALVGRLSAHGADPDGLGTARPADVEGDRRTRAVAEREAA